ncbi:MAG: hypothetical protein AB1696_15310 [Planctomycetota bacterium]
MQALKVRTKVRKNGRLQLPPVPFPMGTDVEVIILERGVEQAELLKASEMSLWFWDNAIDDEAWNATFPPVPRATLKLV